MLIEERGQLYSGMISDHLEHILQTLSDKSIDQYRYLADQYTKVNVSGSAEFQKKFIHYYRMHHTSAEYKRRFFAVLERIKLEKVPDFEQIARELHPISGKHQFSFITKMLHTRFPTFPIYDVFVRQFFCLSNLPYGASLDRKLH